MGQERRGHQSQVYRKVGFGERDSVTWTLYVATGQSMFDCWISEIAMDQRKCALEIGG